MKSPGTEIRDLYLEWLQCRDEAGKITEFQEFGLSLISSPIQSFIIMKIAMIPWKLMKHLRDARLNFTHFKVWFLEVKISFGV